MLQVLPVKCLAMIRPPMLGMNLTLEKAVGQYGWMKCSALDRKPPYMSVPIATGVYIIVDTLKMLV